MDSVNKNRKTSLIPYRITLRQKDAQVSLTNHLEELRQRICWVISTGLLCVGFCALNIKTLVKVLQEPALGIKFLQFAPGEYFFVSIKIIFYTGFLLTLPFLIYQVVLFVMPGMTQGERRNILPLILGALGLFLSGLVFSYFILVPAALGFFIRYGEEVVEPFWSFEQYFEFILVLLFSTGLAFQLPVVQIILGLLRIVSGSKMLSVWRYVILLSTIIGAILTPSVDPFTQIIMSSVVILLYLCGVGIVLLVEKTTVPLG